MEISIMIVSTPSIYAGVPVVDIPMWEFVAAIGGLPLIALGLAALEKYTDFDMTRINNVFSASLPIIAIVFLGWFFLKIGGMFL